jgi:hypothetical protein
MRLKLAMFFVLAAGLLTASPAEAKKVYLNGLDLSEVYLVNQVFKNCTVRIDSKGNVHIKVPGVELKPSGEVKDKKPRKPRKPRKAREDNATVNAKDFYLVSFTNRPGATQYDIEVFINGKFVRRIRSKAKQVMMKVTKFFKKGKNEVMFVCRKKVGSKGRVSHSAQDYLRVVIGRGIESKGRLVLKTSEAEVKRTAAENKEQITDKDTVVVR